MLNTVTVCPRPETARSYLCQQQAVSVHLHLHRAASHSAALDQAKHRWEETHGKKTPTKTKQSQHKTNHPSIRLLTDIRYLKVWLIKNLPVELDETLKISFDLNPPCCRWLCPCTWTSRGPTSSSPLTLTLPPRKTHTASTSVELLSCAPSSHFEPHRSLDYKPTHNFHLLLFSHHFQSSL